MTTGSRILATLLDPKGNIKPKGRRHVTVKLRQKLKRELDKEKERLALEVRREAIKRRMGRFRDSEQSHPPHAQVLNITESHCLTCDQRARIPTTLLNVAKHKTLAVEGSSPARNGRDTSLPLREYVTVTEVVFCLACAQQEGETE